MLPVNEEMIPNLQGNCGLRDEFAWLGTAFRSASDRYGGGPRPEVFVSQQPRTSDDWKPFFACYLQESPAYNVITTDDIPSFADTWSQWLDLPGDRWVVRYPGFTRRDTPFRGLGERGADLLARASAPDRREPSGTFPEITWLAAVFATASSNRQKMPFDHYRFGEGYEEHRPWRSPTLKPDSPRSYLDTLIYTFKDGLFALSATAVELWLTPPAHQTEVAPLFQPVAAVPEPSKPHWDDERGELRWQGRVIRKYERQPAQTQVAILAAFQEADWPATIPNPAATRQISHYQKLAEQKNLRSRIEALNDGLAAGTIRFRAVRGERVAWEPVDADENAGSQSE